jgi:hypothetical protein
MKWNNLKAERPQDGQLVLVFTSSERYFIAQWRNERGGLGARLGWFEWSSGIRLTDVSHWMLLPNPPAG